MKIANFEIGQRTFVIAEIAGNHNGNLDTAMELVLLAKQAGADTVKFQTYDTHKYIDPSVPAMAHVRGKYKNQQERFKSLQFTPGQWNEIIKRCQEIGLLFFSTPADKDSADFLEPHVPTYKIQSGDVTNIPLIRHIAKKNKPIIMSTGMASEAELEAAMREVPQDNIILLHCVSIYPTPPDKVCLGAIQYLKERFGVPVGYSDHTMNSLACLSAVALGSVVIERHFTNNKNQPIGDHRFSAEPGEFRGMVDALREIEKMRDGFYARLSEPELQMRYAMRRGLALTQDIPCGSIISPEILIPLRPEKGIPASRIDYVIGKRTKRDLKKGEFLEEEDISE